MSRMSFSPATGTMGPGHYHCKQEFPKICKPSCDVFVFYAKCLASTNDCFNCEDQKHPLNLISTGQHHCQWEEKSSLCDHRFMVVPKASGHHHYRQNGYGLEVLVDIPKH